MVLQNDVKGVISYRYPKICKPLVVIIMIINVLYTRMCEIVMDVIT